MQRTGQKKMSACVFALVSIILFMPAVGLGERIHDAPPSENQKSVFVSQQAVVHATRAWELGEEGLVVDATEQTSEAVKFIQQAIELSPSDSHTHGRQAIEHLRASKKHFQTALGHWEKGDHKQALDGVMLGRDYAEASILHAQCRDFVCR